MPLYEYRCQDCGRTVEIIQRFSDPPLPECEVCGGELERLLSPAAVHFKGSGWYVTDYARKNDKGSSKEDSSAKAKEEKATSGSDSQSTSGAEKSESAK
ncbi:MAG: FmdB family zinc ribbon protein, partial [Acidobacteriota bacterium]